MSLIGLSDRLDVKVKETRMTLKVYGLNSWMDGSITE